jgi:hypothetical protein
MRIHIHRAKASLAAGLCLVTLLTGMPGVSAAPRRLVLQIHEVKCMDETTGKHREKLGVDTIALGGITIDPASTVKRFTTWNVGVFKKDGVVKRPNSPHQLITVPLQAKMPFPQTFQAVLVLAELDPGHGFNAQLEKIAAAGSKAGMAKAKSLVSVGFDAAVRQAESGEPKPIQVYAAEIGKEILKVKSTEWWEDDLFPPLHRQIRVNAPDHLLQKGKLETPRETLIFTGGRIQGKYAVTYSWKLI